jgi:ubiquinone/menaquinone biosynthesis C-methylase UbiE
MGIRSKNHITIEEFRLAQEDEKEFWRQRQTEIASEKYRKMKRNATMEILTELQSATRDGHLQRVLEIGGGGDPMVEYFMGEIGVVIDPLGRFYKTELFPSQLSTVEYFCGIGESLPFKSDTFDGVLLYNCIDHGIAPFMILDESKRILRQGGAIHLYVDTYSIQFTAYRRILENLFHESKYKEHPNCLRFKSVSKYLKNLGFVELKSFHGELPYFNVLEGQTGTFRNLLKDMIKGRRALRGFYRLE